jgi:hypothetical protein
MQTPVGGDPNYHLGLVPVRHIDAAEVQASTYLATHMPPPDVKLPLLEFTFSELQTDRHVLARHNKTGRGQDSAREVADSPFPKVFTFFIRHPDYAHPDAMELASRHNLWQPQTLVKTICRIFHVTSVRRDQYEFDRVITTQIDFYPTEATWNQISG